MEKLNQIIKIFASNHTSTFGLWQSLLFIFALFLCALMSWSLSIVYVKYGNTLSNKKLFAKNFILLSTTTMFIIMVVKSSLALSLGLVGALSIVRFRSAIKEPEELTYLFLNIGIGLGCGANQLIITILAFFSIVLFIIASEGRFFKKKDKKPSCLSSYLIIVCNNKSVKLSQIVEILSNNCNALKLKRCDEADGRFETSFYIDFDEWKNFENIKTELINLDEKMKITFMDTTKDY